MPAPVAFNPLDKENLGLSVALALSKCPTFALDQLPAFLGAGIYALYYTGAFAPYAALSALNHPEVRTPIYVGKALPEGTRKGQGAKRSTESRKLRGRLREHGRSIAQTQALQVVDFRVRYLVVEETWIGLCESLLIQAQKPLWNSYLDGFGRHVQGKNRNDGLSDWHAFHRGRDLNENTPFPEERMVRLSQEVGQYMADLCLRETR